VLAPNGFESVPDREIAVAIVVAIDTLSTIALSLAPQFTNRTICEAQ